MFLIQFIGSALVAGVLTIGTSFYWPKVTGQPRPEMLQKVYDYVLGTKTGQEAAVTLGAMDERPIDSAAVRQAGSEAVSRVTTIVTEKVSSVVVDAVIDELTKRYDILPPEKQEKVKEHICQ